jgi:hypothetical protein
MVASRAIDVPLCIFAGARGQPLKEVIASQQRLGAAPMRAALF